MALAKCGRHSSFDEFALGSKRPNMARYGRQSSFAGSYCIPSSNCNSTSCSRQNSRAEDNGGMRTPLEIKRPLEGEKRHSGEGRRLLEGGDRASTFMIEEEKSSGGLAVANCLRRAQQDKISAEMEKLLSETSVAPAADQESTMALEATDTPNEDLDVHTQNGGSVTIYPEEQNSKNNKEGTEESQLHSETRDTSSESSEATTANRGESKNTINSKEKNVQFCDSPSAKVSVV